MVRAGAAALSVTTLWIVFQLALLTAWDYSYGDNPSSKIFEGGYLVHWVRELGPRAAVVALITTFGALYLLVPAGLVVAPARLRQWALASLPAVAAFGYVQQTDRAIWNFHFLATPLAALALSRLPSSAVWGFVAAYGAANLRVGAQLPWVPGARFFLLISTLLAVWAVALLWRDRRQAAVTVATPAARPVERSHDPRRPPRRRRQRRRSPRRCRRDGRFLDAPPRGDRRRASTSGDIGDRWRRRDGRTKCAWRLSADRALTVPACRSKSRFRSTCSATCGRSGGRCTRRARSRSSISPCPWTTLRASRIRLPTTRICSRTST